MPLVSGLIKVFSGKNWKLAGDGKWTEVSSYVANGNEVKLGQRMIDGQMHEVYKMCDDDFGAQPIASK